MLKCPHDQTELKTSDFKGIKIDECETCKGKWFDKDELRRAKDAANKGLIWLDVDLFEDKEHKFSSTQSKEKCPKDQSNMQMLTYSQSKVKVDRCSACQGVWLDKNEFERIVKYLEETMYNKSAAEYSKETLKEPLEIGTGPENKISELKDFLTVMSLFQTRLVIEQPWTTKLYETIYTNLPLK